jgi:hypothetical protein
MKVGGKLISMDKEKTVCGLTTGPQNQLYFKPKGRGGLKSERNSINRSMNTISNEPETMASSNLLHQNLNDSSLTTLNQTSGNLKRVAFNHASGASILGENHERAREVVLD